MEAQPFLQFNNCLKVLTDLPNAVCILLGWQNGIRHIYVLQNKTAVIAYRHTFSRGDTPEIKPALRQYTNVSGLVLS